MGIRQRVVLCAVAAKRRKFELLAASCLVPLSLGVSEPALAQTFPAGNYPGGISVGGNTSVNVTLAPGVSVGTPALPAAVPIAVGVDNTSGGPGDGAAAT